MRGPALLLLAALCHASAAHCFDVPAEDRRPFPVFSGSPREVVETTTRTAPDVPAAGPDGTARTFRYAAGRLTRVHRVPLTGAAPASGMQELWNFDPTAPDRVVWQYRRAAVPAPSAPATPASGVGIPTALASAHAIQGSITLDAQGRLTEYRGLTDEGDRTPRPIQVSCTYSAQLHRTTERATVDRQTRFTLLAITDAEGRLRTVETTRETPGSPAQHQLVTYTYGPDGHLDGSETTVDGGLALRQRYVTDAAGRVTGLAFADLPDVQEAWAWTYDARGNWVTRTGSVQGRPFETTVRVLRY